MKIVAFAPHPDDDIIGCGGSLLKHRDADAEVSVVYLTSGDAGARQLRREEIGAIREQEARGAAAAMGIHDLTFLRLPDGFLSTRADAVPRLISLVRETRPDIVYLPHAADGHPDHQAAHRLVLAALSGAAGPWYPETSGESFRVGTVLGYEVWTPIQTPTYLEDTTDWHHRQLAALAHHRSQLGAIAYEQFLDGLNSFRGAALERSRKAEAFEVLALRVGSIGRLGA